MEGIEPEEKGVEQRSVENLRTSQAIDETRAHGAEFGTFDEEARRFSSEVFCPTAKVTAPEGSGRVFGCVLSESATVKFAIHELERTGRVENVKVMWNDCLVDIGRGVHVDRFEAELLVKMTARLYAPGAEADLLAIFKSSKAQTTRRNGFLFKYTYDGGPMVADRLLMITKL